MASEAPLQLFYFPVRGRLEGTRLLLELTGTPYEYTPVTSWPGDMKAKTPFGQLPFLIHGDLEVAQSMAILRYVARLTSEY